MNKGLIQKLTGTGKNSLLPVIFFSIIIIAIFIIIYNLNKIYPTYIDDWDYSFVYYTNDKLNSIFDIIPSMMKHYTMWGGRLVVHSLLQEFLYFGPFWADLFNSLMFATYTILVYAIVNRGNKVRPSVVLIIFLLTWFFQADLGETILWLTGSANYLWGTTIILAFLYPYYTYFTDSLYDKSTIKKDEKGLGYRVLFLFLGIIAGWTNENMVVALFCMIAAFLFIIWMKKRVLEKWSAWGVAGICIGAALMLLAPGNFKRYSSELKLRDITGKPTIDYYLDNIHMLSEGILKYLLIPLAIYFALMTFFWVGERNTKKKGVLFTSLIFLCGSFIATIAMTASPVFPPRAWFGVITLLIISISIIYANLNFSKIYIRIPAWLCIIFTSVMFIKTYTEGRDELIRIRTIVDAREMEVNKQKAEGKDDIILHSKRFQKRDDLIIPKMYDFPEDPEHWMFKAYAHYHEVRSVKIVEENSNE